MEEQCQQKSSIFFVFSLFFFAALKKFHSPLSLSLTLSLVFSLHVTASVPSCSEKHTQWCIYNIVFSTTTF